MAIHTRFSTGVNNIGVNMKRVIKKFVYIICAVMLACSAICLFITEQGQVVLANSSSTNGYYNINQDVFDYIIVDDKDGNTECLDVNYRVNEDNAYTMVSRYKFVTDGLNADDKVFDITY